jgi:hypothetical protein
MDRHQMPSLPEISTTSNSHVFGRWHLVSLSHPFFSCQGLEEEANPPPTSFPFQIHHLLFNEVDKHVRQISIDVTHSIEQQMSAKLGSIVLTPY